MAKPLEVDVAQLKVDDQTTGTLKKVNKSVGRTNKQLEKTEKETEKIGKGIKKTGNIFNRTFRKIQDGTKKTADKLKSLGRGTAKAPGKTVQTGGKLAGGIGSGGGLGSALGNLPFGFGAIVAAGFAAVESVRRDFISGLGVKRELLGIANDFNISLKDERKRVLKEFQKTGVFRTEDIQAAATSLADAGVSGEAIKKNADILSKFALSQGFTDISEAIAAVQGGQVKAGRGIKTADIVQFREISGLLSNVETADIGFQLLTDILEKNRNSITAFSDQTVKNLGKVNKQQNEQIKFEQDRAIKAASIDDTLVTSSRTFVNIADNLKRGLAGPSGKILSATVNKLDTLSRWFGFGSIKPKSRQLGGTANANQSFIVGERGPEFFTPKQSGQIITNEKVNKLINSGRGQGQGMGKAISINAPITIHVASGTPAGIAQKFGREFENMVMKVMNKYADTNLRDQLGV